MEPELRQRQALAALAGVAPQDVRIELRLPHGIQTNRLYDVWARGEHWIAKWFIVPGESQACAAREHAALTWLAPLDLAPQPVAWLQAGAAPVVVYRYLPGEAWDRRIPSAGDLERLLQVLLQLHSLPTNGLWPSNAAAGLLDPGGGKLALSLEAYAAWTAALDPVASPAAARCLRLCERLRPALLELAQLPAEARFCKLDPRFANLIDRPDGRLGLVDWEDSGLRDPALELADLTLHPNQEDLVSPQAWQALLVEYTARQADLDPGLPRRIRLYQALFPLFWLSVLTRHGMRLAETGGLTGWRVNEMEVNQRLRRYLAHGEAWLDGDFSGRLGELRELVFFSAGVGWKDG